MREVDVNSYNKSPNVSFLEQFTDQEIIGFYNDSASYLEFCKKLGYKNYIDKTNKSVSERLNRLGITSEKYKYQKMVPVKRVCSNCGNEIYDKNKTGLCYKCYVENMRRETVENWLKNGDTNCLIGSNIRNSIREFLYKDQDYKCAICGIKNIWNGKELKFVLDHIDGDASNNCRENMRLICSNCDSQLNTYKSKNKNSARNYRHKYYDENKTNETIMTE